MKQEGLSYFTDTHLTVLGLIIFFAFFIGVVWWVSQKSRRGYYSEMEKMPLNDAELLYERQQ